MVDESVKGSATEPSRRRIEPARGFEMAVVFHTTHDEGKVTWKYFAVPESMCEKAWQYLCDNGHKDWGLIPYNETGGAWIKYRPICYPHSSQSKKLTFEERFAIARLGTMRIWNLKGKLVSLKKH